MCREYYYTFQKCLFEISFASNVWSSNGILSKTKSTISDAGGIFRGNGSIVNRVLANSSPIHAATPPISQQPIISMEDDEISDQEIVSYPSKHLNEISFVFVIKLLKFQSNLEDHGHFKSLSRLWEHLPHLAVFTNYVLSNSDPNSLMFYLLTDLYKEGNAKEMRKWAFEIHSCFLVPGAVSVCLLFKILVVISCFLFNIFFVEKSF